MKPIEEIYRKWRILWQTGRWIQNGRGRTGRLARLLRRLSLDLPSHWQRQSSGFPILLLDYVGNARINGCRDAIVFLSKVESNHEIAGRKERVDRPRSDPLTHFADTHPRPLEHVGAAQKRADRTSDFSGIYYMIRKEKKSGKSSVPSPSHREKIVVPKTRTRVEFFTCPMSHLSL